MENVVSEPAKLCFVTIGATAPFDSLLRAVLQPSFLQALQSAKYTELLIQHGKEGGAIFNDFVAQKDCLVEDRVSVTVKGFDFNQDGLGREMRTAKGIRSTDHGSGTREGVVICHAGMFTTTKVELAICTKWILRVGIHP